MAQQGQMMYAQQGQMVQQQPGQMMYGQPGQVMHQQPGQMVYQQPGQVMHQQQAGPPLGKWTSSCGDMFEDMEVCLITFIFSPVAHGVVYDKVHGGGCFVPCCLYVLGMEFCGLSCCICGPKRRRGVREKYGLPEDPCNDCCMECWCAPCAICQDWRELKKRGAA